MKPRLYDWLLLVVLILLAAALIALGLSFPWYAATLARGGK